MCHFFEGFSGCGLGGGGGGGFGSILSSICGGGGGGGGGGCGGGFNSLSASNAVCTSASAGCDNGNDFGAY